MPSCDFFVAALHKKHQFFLIKDEHLRTPNPMPYQKVFALKYWLWEINMFFLAGDVVFALQWQHNKHDGVSNHRRLDCLHNLFSGTDQR